MVLAAQSKEQCGGMYEVNKPMSQMLQSMLVLSNQGFTQDFKFGGEVKKKLHAPAKNIEAMPISSHHTSYIIVCALLATLPGNVH